MDNNYTDISIILDRSGSMGSIKKSTIDGFNGLLSEQKNLEGDACLTLIQFDNEYQMDYNATPIKEVLSLNDKTYQPRGATALHDAIGKTIKTAGRRFSAMAENDRPAKVLFVIITDGYENASSNYNAKEINDLITHQTEKYNWTFVFMGANQDAILAARDLGVESKQSLTFAANEQGAEEAFQSLSNKMHIMREASVSEAKFEFSKSDRKKQRSAGAQKDSFSE